MGKIRFSALTLVICLLASCAPSSQAIQNAIAQTQAAYTPTPTLVPTPTMNPCTDHGWADIITYMNQYDLQEKNLVVGTSKSAYLLGLNNFKDKINGVVIDACTEHARQLVVSGIANRIYTMQLILSDGDETDWATAMVQGIKMIQDAETELKDLGLNVILP